MSVKDLLPFERPREKMQKKGAASLSNLELLAALLGSGVKDHNVFSVAKKLLHYIQQNSQDLKFSDVAKIEGMGSAKACQVLAAFEIAKRFLIKENVCLNQVHDVLPLVEDIRHKKQEYFLTITVDGAKNLIAKRIIFIGTLNQSMVHPREVFADAISDRAAGIIFIHNHPSGQCEPSEEDLQTTQKLIEAAKLLGIEVLDHIIVGQKGHYSFVEEGVLV